MSLTESAKVKDLAAPLAPWEVEATDNMLSISLNYGTRMIHLLTHSEDIKSMMKGYPYNTIQLRAVNKVASAHHIY